MSRHHHPHVRPECLDTTIHFNRSGGNDQSVDDLTQIKLQAVNEMMRKVNEKYPVGGIILYAHNIEDEAQLARFIPEIRALKGSPLLCIDEEGGRVARIGRNSNFNVKTYESMGAIGATGDPRNAYECGNTIGTYLHRYMPVLRAVLSTSRATATRRPTRTSAMPVHRRRGRRCSRARW